MTERNRILLRAAAILTVAAALLCLYLGVLSLGMPMPRCAFLEVTGWQCPGCGSQRALAALLHGHPLEAWRYNLMLPPALAMILLLWLLPQGSRLKERLTSRAAIAVTPRCHAPLVDIAQHHLTCRNWRKSQNCEVKYIQKHPISTEVVVKLGVVLVIC